MSLSIKEWEGTQFVVMKLLSSIFNIRYNDIGIIKNYILFLNKGNSNSVVFWDMIVAFFQQGQNGPDFGMGKTDVVC